jgi:chromosomal replication initiation ATPase DnaA
MTIKVELILERARKEIENITGRQVQVTMQYIDRMNPEGLLSAIAQTQGVTLAEIQSKSRKRSLAVVRHALSKILHQEYGMSYGAIGKLLHRDHATCIYGAKSTAPRVKTMYEKIYRYRFIIKKEDKIQTSESFQMV